MTLSPLADARFRRLFAAQAIALAGTGLSTVALALLAYDLAGGDAGLVLGAALALKMIAYVGVAPVAGAFAGRLPRRALLVALDIGRAACVLCLPFVDAMWQVFVLIFLLNAFSAGFTPTFQATIPDILPEEARYTRALSLSRLAYDLEALLSPTLAALLLTAMSYHALFAFNAAAFLASAGLVLATRLPSGAPSELAGGPLAKLSFGVRAYLATPRLRGLLLVSLSVAAAGSMVIVNTVVYVRDRLGGDETDMALAMAAFGGGSMLAALLLPRVLDRLPDRPVMLAGCGLMAAGLFLGLLMPALPGLLALWTAIGLGYGLAQTPGGRLLRRSSGEADRPAYFSAQFALSHTCWLVAYPAAGWLGSAFGLPLAFVVLGLLAVCALLAAARAWPARDPEALEHEHRPDDHEHLHIHDSHHRHEHEGWQGPEPHRHRPHRHAHAFRIDAHHPRWPSQPAG